MKYTKYNFTFTIDKNCVTGRGFWVLPAGGVCVFVVCVCVCVWCVCGVCVVCVCVCVCVCVVCVCVYVVHRNMQEKNGIYTYNE